MTKSLKMFLPVAIILVLLLSVILAGCTSDNSANGNKLVLASSAQELVFVEDEDTDLTKIKFSVVDSSGNVTETVFADQSMLSTSDLNKLRIAGVYTVVINYKNMRLNVQVSVSKAVKQIGDYKVFFDCNEVYGANNTPNRGHFAESEFSIMEAPDEYINGNKLVSLPIPYLAGFVFKGWYADRNGTGTKLNVQTENPYILTAETTNFYAQWEDQRKFTVRFVNQITNVEIGESQTIEYGKSAIVPSDYIIGNNYNLNNTRYVFAGWQVDGDGSYTNVTQNTVLYATFTILKVSVTFYKADNATVYTSFQVNYGGTFDRDDIPPEFFDSEHPQAAYTAVWIDTKTNSELDADITNLTEQRKIYIQYTPKPMYLTFYNITKAEYDALGGNVPAQNKQVFQVEYKRTLGTVPAPPQYADDPSTTEVNESLKYNTAWRTYNGDISSVPNFLAEVVTDIDFFVYYSVKTFSVVFRGYGEDISRQVIYGNTLDPISLSPTIENYKYNPLVSVCTWHTNMALDDDKVFLFSTRITQNYILYLKVTPKNIDVYYSMPSYYSLNGQSIYDKPVDFTVDDVQKMINIDGGAYSFEYTAQIPDLMSPPEDGLYSPAYALAHQSVSPSSADLRPSYNFQKYRQDTYINGTTKWYDYDKTDWNFSTNFYNALRNYLITNNVSYVVLYAAICTNELQLSFKNISYAGGVDNPQFYDLVYGSAFPYIIVYGEAFDPNAYIASLSPFEITAPVIPDEEIDFAFGGWYTTPGYRPGTKILEGESITVTSDTVFYAKWVDADTGSQGLIYEQISDTEYAVAGYNYPQDKEDILRIPLMHDGLTVTTIRAGALDVFGASDIREIELRSGISDIEEGAFTSLTGLTAIIINGNSNYYSVQNGVLYTSNMTTLVKCPASLAVSVHTVPATVTRIAKEAFALNYNITELAFESGSALTEISERAFWECENLVTAALPISIKHIGERAFYESAKLDNINLSAGQYDILTCGFKAFDGTRWLSSRTGQVILGNVLVMYKDDSTSATSITVDDAVSTVADGAFSQESVTLSLQSITFGIDSNLKRIGNLAFNACPLLAVIDIKCATLVEIQSDSFSGISLDSVLYVEQTMLTQYLAEYTNIETSEVLIDVSSIEAGA